MSDRAGRRPRLSVVIPSHETRDLTLACLASLRAAGAPGDTPVGAAEVLLVDDGSRDGTAGAVCDRFPGVRVLRNETAAGFTATANRGMAAAEGELLLLLNSDTETGDGAWNAIDAAFRDRPKLGVAGAALRNPDGTPQWSGRSEPTGSWLFALASGIPRAVARIPGLRRLRPVAGWRDQTVDWVTGAAMVVRRPVWEAVGPFDASFHLYCQDLDLCLRARDAGWEVGVIPGFRVLHHGGATVRRQPGAAGHQNPELLWSELVRWAGKRGGRRRARRAARALKMGGWLRLVGRWLAAPFRGHADREKWRRVSASYREAIAAAEREARRA